MKRHILAGTVLALMAGTAQAQAPARDPGPNAPIRYDVRFDNAAHHEARISVTYRRSEEHTSELQSLMRNSYAVFCLKKTKTKNSRYHKHIRRPITIDYI